MKLSVRDLCKTFQTPAGARLEVLRGVSFTAEAGEMLAITGASGAGKSTLLHLLGALDAAESGSIKVGEVEVVQMRGVELARFRSRMVGFVFQSHHLLPDLTAIENVAMPLLIERVSRRKSLARAEEMLESLEMREQASQSVGQLSGGEQQRVAIARALVREPPVVLADEPTGNLDASLSDEVGAIFHSYCRTHQAIIIIATHNERLALACDRALLLQNGGLGVRGW